MPKTVTFGMFEKVRLTVSKNIRIIHIQKVEIRSTQDTLILILYIDIRKNTHQQDNRGTENRTDNGCFGVELVCTITRFLLGRQTHLQETSKELQESQGGCSSDIASSYFFCLSKVLSIIHHGSVPPLRVQNRIKEI